MNVVFENKFKEELKKNGGNIIIAGIMLDSDFELIPVIGSKNSHNNTLETYFELPEEKYGLVVSSIRYYWNVGSENTNDQDKLVVAFTVSDSGGNIELSKHRNLISIELPEDTKSEIVFKLPESDFRFLERSDPFVQENLTRKELDKNKPISPEPFYQTIYATGTLDNRKPLDIYGRENRVTVYKQYKELKLTCDSTTNDFGRTVRYGLYQDVPDDSYNSLYFQGSAVYDEYTYQCGKLIEVRENLSTPINTVEGIHLVTTLIDISGGTSDPKNATKFIADDSRFCVDYSRMIDLALCTCDVYAEVYVYNEDLDNSLKVIKSNTVRITQQPEDISLMIIPNPRDEEKYYKTTVRDVKRFNISSGTSVVIINPEEREDLILIHSVDPITSDSIYLDYGDSIREAFDITIKRVDIKKQNIELGIKIRTVEGYVTRKAATWYPLRKLKESAEPWLYTVKVNCSGHVFEFCPVIKNTYFDEAEITIEDTTEEEEAGYKVLKVSLETRGNRRIYFGLAEGKKSIILTDREQEKIIRNGRIQANKDYLISFGDLDKFSIYQSDSYIDDYVNNTDWRKEVAAHLYTINLDTNNDETENL